MTTAIRITLPWPVLVSANHRAAHVGDRLRSTRRYRAAKDAARALVASQTRTAPLLTGPVEVRLRFWTPDNRRRDPDNLLKLIHDSMTGFVYEDDSQIRRQVWEVVGVDRDNARVEVTVTALGSVGAEPTSTTA